MKAKNYLRLLQTGVLFSVFIVLFVFRTYLFPYISSKQIIFNVLVEFLAAFTLIFVIKYREYRPKLDVLIYTLVAYFLVILVSAFTGVDFNLSFWGDIERMLGFFHIFHFFLYFLVIIVAFRSWPDYRRLFQASLFASVIVSLIGIFGPKVYSTIGNTTFVSAFLLFNIFFALILFIRSSFKSRYLYLLSLIPLLWQFSLMKTSGAIIALGVGVIVTLLVVGLLAQNKAWRQSFLAVTVAAILAVVFLFSQQEASWFQHSFLKNLTGQKNTFQTRLISWRGALADFPNHPLLGTGYGNYAITFDKYFPPNFYNYDRSETYFDRAHNNIIDIASTTGILGLLSYLAIFAVIFLYLYRLLKRGSHKINASPAGQRNLELVLLFALIIVYFIQNLAVFDSFVSYINLMIVFAYIYFLYHRKEVYQTETEVEAKPSLGKGWETSLLVVVLIATYIFTSFYNLETVRMLKGSIESYNDLLGGDIIEGFDSLKDVLKERPLERDSRKSIVNLITSNPVILSALKTERAQEEFDYLMSLAQLNLSYNPLDSQKLLQTAQLYFTGAYVFFDNAKLRQEYGESAYKLVNQSIASSPGRITHYYVKSNIESLLDRQEESIATLEYARDLNPDFVDSSCHLAASYDEARDKAKFSESLLACVDNKGLSRVSTLGNLIDYVQYFIDIDDYDRAILVLERIVELQPNDANMWLNLAKMYRLTEVEESKLRPVTNRILELDPSLIDQVEYLYSLD